MKINGVMKKSFFSIPIDTLVTFEEKNCGMYYVSCLGDSSYFAILDSYDILKEYVEFS